MEQTPASLRGHHELDRLTTGGEVSTGSVETDRTSDGLKVPPIESVTLSDGKGQENAHSAAVSEVRWLESDYYVGRPDRKILRSGESCRLD
jgi:hypothetical protein